MRISIELPCRNFDWRRLATSATAQASGGGCAYLSSYQYQIGRPAIHVRPAHHAIVRTERPIEANRNCLGLQFDAILSRFIDRFRVSTM